MENKTAQAIKSAKTKERISNCAQKLFYKYGYDNVTMEDIAKASRTSIGSIYHFFTNKECLSFYPATMLDDKHEASYSRLRTKALEKNLSAREQLIDFFVEVQENAASFGSLALAQLYVYGLHQKNKEVLDCRRNRKLPQFLFELIKECRSEGSIRSSLSNEEIVHQIIYASRGLIIEWIVCGEGFDLHGHSRIMIKLLLDNNE